MKILLVNVDSRWNMAIRKMFNYYRKEHDVEMIDLGFSGYPHKKTKTIDAAGYDKVFVSNIFDVNSDNVQITNCSDVVFGGIGSKNPHLQLPCDVEMTEPYYFPDETISYGFITRGCIRNCWFCKVPKYEGKLKEYNTIESIVKHKKVKFLDNNILAYPDHMKVFQWCLDHPDIKVEFNQGLDFRLVNDENLEALSKLNYMGEYIFAFDEPKYQPLLEKKLVLMKKYISKPWKLKFYIYYHPSMDLKQLFERVEWCRKNECLPYVMRDVACWDCEKQLKEFLIDYAAYCNQPAHFKKQTFHEFLQIRYKNQERIQNSLEMFAKSSGEHNECKNIKEKEKKEMELKVQTPTFPEVIEFNFEELKQEITTKASKYANLVYTEEQIPDAKKDRATLNKFVKALSDERIKVKKECLKPYEDFEVKIKELDGIVSEAIKNIDSQVKTYEEEKKKEKEEKIHLLIDAIIGEENTSLGWLSSKENTSLGWLAHEQIWNDKWLNASVSIKSIQEELNEILARIEKDLITLGKMPEIAFEAIDEYKRSLDLNKAIAEGRRIADIQKFKEEQKQAEVERLKQDEQLAEQEPPAEPRQWLGFKAYLTVEDAQQLAEFFKNRGIQFEKINL